MVNRAACNELADFIASEKWGFDMRTGFVRPACGSAGCIGGHAAALWPEIARDQEYHNGESYFDFTKLQQKLDIDYDTGFKLCYASPGGPALHEVTRAMAVSTLRHLGETGEVDFQ